MGDGLTEAAKNELKEAIRIVREDRFEKYARERIKHHATNPANPGVEPPPVKTGTETDPPVTDPPGGATGEKSKSGYWGELLED